jgi:uncharacterized cofD-like protein
VRTALSETRGHVVYVCNVMTQPGETDAYSAADHLDALRRHGMRGVVGIILVNDCPVSAEMAAAYQLQGAQPVVVDEQRVRALGVRVVRASMATERDVVRHDPGQLAEALLQLTR